MSTAVAREVAARNAAAKRWVQAGTALFLAELEALSDTELGAASRLPGWNRTHLVGHVGLNADALRNLLAWARTGIETPMYSSPEQRRANIEQAGGWPGARVRTLAAESAKRLADDLAALTDEQWQAPIRTAQGRIVSCTEVPWMRAREVMVHSVDLGTGVSFTDLPEDFSVALIADIAEKRSAGEGRVVVESTDPGYVVSVTTPEDGTVRVSGDVAPLAAWLSGRSSGAGLVADAGSLPALGPWL